MNNFRCSIVAVVGRPNVGKSSLVNALVDNDISITSVHPHTTRRQIRAIDNGENYQIVYVDTPGIHKPNSAMAEQMNDYAYDAIDGVDLVIGVFDASKQIGKGDNFVAQRLRNLKNVILVLNKADVETKFENVAKRAQEVSDLVPDAKHVFILSAFTKKNVHLLKSEIIDQLIVGSPLFDQNAQHDLTDNQLVGEIYREALIRLLRDELPQGIAVIAKEDTQLVKPNKRVFDINVMVLRNSHKAIVIGKSGSILEKAGSSARKRCEALLGCSLVLRAHVKVDEKWQSRPENLETYFF